MDEIEKFSQRYSVSADEIRRFVAEADKDRPLWPRVLDYLAGHGVEAVYDDLQALSIATGEALRQRLRAAPAVAAPEAPAAAPERRVEPATATEAVDRLRAILEAPEAVGREAFARHLALNSPLSAAEAIEALKTVPASGAMPAPQAAPRPAIEPKPERQALVRVYPPSWLPPQLDGSGRAEWSNVLAKVNGGKA